MTVHTVLQCSISAALVAAALFGAPDAARACGQWDETEEKTLAFDEEGTRALVLATTTRFGYDGTTTSHRLFVVDLTAPRADGALLATAGVAIEIHLSVRERAMPAETLATRLVRRHVAAFPVRV